MALAGIAYLVPAVGLWWGLWSSHPTSTATCGCGDAARFQWFFAWPAYALTHGHDVLYSQWLFHPVGINLLDDTSVVALGVVLAPVTWAFGPIAAVNVALTLAPALSALAMFVLLLRWVRWWPAAFVGGLVYGFSPFVVTELALNQLNIAFLAIPPLVVLVVADLLVTQDRTPWRSGAALAALVVVQFFLSTEVLVITGLATLVGVVLVVGWAAVRTPAELGPRVGHAVRASAIALGLSVVALAYPLWFLLDGPAHLVGPIWSYGATARFGTTPSSFVATGGLEGLRQPMLRFGGYQGPVLVGLGYLGLGVLVASVVGTVVFRRDRRLLFFAALGLVMAALSLGPGHGVWVPWDVLQRIPWIGDIVEVRFVAVVTLCAAALVGLTLDHTRMWLGDRPGSGAGARRVRSSDVVGWTLGVAVLLPTVVALWPNLPLTVRPVVLPPWFAQVAPTLPPGRVVLPYPTAFSGFQSSEAWQAVNRMQWAQAGGGGPEGQAARSGDAAPGFRVLAAASLPLGAAPVPTRSNVVAVRHALAVWHVTTVVVPDQATLAPYAQGRSTAYAVGFFTAVLGARPVHDHGAWVWDGVGRAPSPVPVPSVAFDACSGGAGPAGPMPDAVATCVLGAAGGGRG